MTDLHGVIRRDCRSLQVAYRHARPVLPGQQGVCDLLKPGGRARKIERRHKHRTGYRLRQPQQSAGNVVGDEPVRYSDVPPGQAPTFSEPLRHGAPLTGREHEDQPSIHPAAMAGIGEMAERGSGHCAAVIGQENGHHSTPNETPRFAITLCE